MFCEEVEALQGGDLCSHPPKGIRDYIVDSGAGLHIVDPSVLTNEELLTKHRLKKTITRQGNKYQYKLLMRQGQLLTHVNSAFESELIALELSLNLLLQEI